MAYWTNEMTGPDIDVDELTYTNVFLSGYDLHKARRLLIEARRVPLWGRSLKANRNRWNRYYNHLDACAVKRGLPIKSGGRRYSVTVNGELF